MPTTAMAHTITQVIFQQMYHRILLINDSKSLIAHKNATKLMCPINVLSHSPDLKFQTLIVLSSDAAELIRPSPITFS